MRRAVIVGSALGLVLTACTSEPQETPTDRPKPAADYSADVSAGVLTIGTGGDARSDAGGVLDVEAAR